MSRTAKLTPEILDAIVKSLAVGATRKDTTDAAGISHQCFLNWLERGEKAGSGKKEAIYVELFEAVTKAEGEVAVRFTTTIAKAAAEGDWRAADTWLKKRRRADWGDNVDVTSGGEAIAFVVERRKDEPDKN